MTEEEARLIRIADQNRRIEEADKRADKRGEANERQVGGDHYQAGIQHWDFVLANDIPYMEAQIIKYVYRWRKKNGLQDLEKARHFLDKLIEWVSEEAVKPDADTAVPPK